jgi:hypothetical protein
MHLMTLFGMPLLSQPLHHVVRCHNPDTSGRLWPQVLVTNAVSVDQWTYQFKLWTTIQDECLGRFTSSAKEWFAAPAGVMVCTYSMIAGSFKRSKESQRIFDAITGREWGLILLDEVHVVPAEMFRRESCCLPAWQCTHDLWHVVPADMFRCAPLCLLRTPRHTTNVSTGLTVAFCAPLQQACVISEKGSRGWLPAHSCAAAWIGGLTAAAPRAARSSASSRRTASSG